MIRRYYEPGRRTPPAVLLHKTLKTLWVSGHWHNRMQPRAHIFLIFMAVLALAGCVYQAPIAQGNLLKQEDVDQVEAGMTRGQVRFLLGTPMIDDPFHLDRWDYIYYLKIGRRDATFKRWVSVVFEGDRVVEIIEDQKLSPDL